MEPLGVYGWIYGYPVPSEFDDFQMEYLNPRHDTKMKYEDKNYKMFVNEFEEADAGKQSYI
eukprot:CAMPEP_0170507316 /NCGR_PEP_ID=MMETSP0208-20121228/58473_1 /TAXON_ID=197538 /ORGANISM="Strombidium inclinatum, Strain S3" /LENGTH=60 /DNA_ID=CAMNT_0010789431 /DNA_START=96 /DNA_END=278 /DNA_ORIENTATION=-